MDKMQRQIEEATKIALRHDDVHPFQVAIVASNALGAAMPSGATIPSFKGYIVGLLHDAIEDGYTTEYAVLSAFGGEICSSVEMLTRGDGERYFEDYINRIKTYGTELVKQVKLADARVNLSRCEVTMGRDSLAPRYRRVIQELTT